MSVKIEAAFQENHYAYTRFDVDGACVLLRVGPAKIPFGQLWYAEVSSVRGDYLINQQFYSRDEAAAYAVRLYEKVVVGGDSSFG